MSDRAITLDEVDSLVAKRSHRGSFSTGLEQQFERDSGSRRAKFLRNSAVRTAAIYNVFLIGDPYLARDTLPLSIALHLGVVTPYLLIVAWLLPRASTPAWREALAASIAVAMSMQILAIFSTTNSPYASHYLYFVPSTVLSLCAVQRLRAVHATASAALIFVLLLLALAVKQDVSVEIAVMHVMIYAICVTVTVNSNLLIEREQRWHYLVALREKLHAKESDDDANHDPLTGLGNRRYLDACASQLWSVGAAADRCVSAIVFDVDHFKSFNDRYGHGAGDSCLKRIAACVTAELRDPHDVAFRIGGEEFLVLLPFAEQEVAVGVAERIRGAIAGLGIPHEASGCADVVTASFGVAAGQVGNRSVADLLATADGALYLAKRDGRNRTRQERPSAETPDEEKAA